MNRRLGNAFHADPWAITLFFLIYWLRARKMLPADEDYDLDQFRCWVCSAIPIICMFSFGIWGFNRAADSAKYLINPEFYAVRDLLTLVLNPGALQ